MDFAELSGLEFKFFDDYKENLVEKFTEDVNQEIITAEKEYKKSFKNFSSYILKGFPITAPFAVISDHLYDGYQLSNDHIPNQKSINIKDRVITKFTETINEFGSVFTKVTNAYQKEITEKDETIRCLNNELDDMINLFKEKDPIKVQLLEIRRLRSELQATHNLNRILQKNLRDLNQEHYKRMLIEREANKAKNLKIDELNDQIYYLENQLKGKLIYDIDSLLGVLSDYVLGRNFNKKVKMFACFFLMICFTFYFLNTATSRGMITKLLNRLSFSIICTLLFIIVKD